MNTKRQEREPKQKDKRVYTPPAVVSQEPFSTYALNCKFGGACTVQAPVRS